MSSRRPLRQSLFGLFAFGVPAAATLLAAAPAHAQDTSGASSNCPPGSWFCADAEKPAAQPRKPARQAATDDDELEPLPPADAPRAAPPAPPPPPAPPVRYRPAAPPPPVVVYEQTPPPPPPPPYYYYYRPRPRPMAQTEWGINLRAEGALQGNGSQSTQPMEGVGIGLRFRPAPAFALEAAFDFLGGRDYYNDPRHETEFTVNAMVFVNPRSRVQLYLLAGLGGAWANVQNTPNAYGSYWSTGEANYTYFGGQAGVGLEFRIAKHFAMNFDARAFLRSRTDSASATSPEYVDPNTGQTTNTSDGCLLTGGMTFYF
jgi:opacity protein-like surface antigen